MRDLLPVDINETEVQSIAEWLNDAKATNVYETPHSADSSIIYDNEVEDITKPNIVSYSEDDSNFIDVEDATTDLNNISKDEKATDVSVNFLPETQSLTDEDQDEADEESNEVESLINDIEASFESLGQEAVGELLLDLLLSEDEIKQDEIQKPLYINDLGKADFQEEVGLEQSPLAKFSEYLDDFDPDIRTKAIEVISSISQVIQVVRAAEDMPEDEKDLLIIELEIKLRELFTTLGFEVEDEIISQYIKLLLLTRENSPADLNEYDIDYLNSMGTREYKPSLTAPLLSGSSLQNVYDDEVNHAVIIGKYTLQVCLS